MTAILFDLDGTLIDSLPNITDAANAVLARWTLPSLPPQTVAGFVGLGEEVFVDRLIEATDLDLGERTDILAAFIEHYKVQAGKTALFPGVARALHVLKQDGLPLGLVTNKPRAPLIPTLEAAHLTDAFDIVLAGDDLPLRKPDPLPLVTAMERLGQKSAVYIGDSETDAKSAEAAQMPFVLFTEGIRTSPVASLTHAAKFSDFNELPDILRQFA